MMENQVEEMGYETPCVKMIEVEVEQGFAVSDGGRTPMIVILYEG